METRLNDDGSIDEIVAENVSVHLEQLSDSEWYLDIDGVQIILSSHTVIKAMPVGQ